MNILFTLFYIKIKVRKNIHLINKYYITYFKHKRIL